MLKIKDNVDLKELEKFCFKDKGKYYKRDEGYNFFRHKWYGIKVNKETRIITIYNYGKVSKWEKDATTELEADDLIKADLVEKVGE